MGLDEEQLQTDELHFIITHQSLELWFKLMLAELRLARDHLSSPKLEEQEVPHYIRTHQRFHNISGNFYSLLLVGALEVNSSCLHEIKQVLAAL